ncbi:MAG: GDP-L-fucose synthase [Chthoniobacterales bacterium]|nr:GDP-L-fucose synthase [Chthoniobacterales bacterium]
MSTFKKLPSSQKIYIAGHRGMVGSALVRAFQAQGCENLVLRTRQELDLCDAVAVRSFFEQEKPSVVIVAAARVGGIHANSTYPAEFIHENLASAHNIIHEAYRHGVKQLLFLGSSCIYPREAPQPMKEEYLLSGPLESTNEAYAIAKIAGLKLCQFYRQQYGVLFHSAMPTNLYGPGDNYHSENSHVLPALLRRFHEAVQIKAPSVTLWGTGKSLREFLHVDDLASALLAVLAMETPPDWINAGSGTDVTIRELAELIARITGFEGKLEWDTTRPDGTPRKLMDSGKLLATGWRPKFSLESGIRHAYADFLNSLQKESLREI